MAQRVRGNPRCRSCGLTPRLCLCAELPRLRFATPIVVVQHNRELEKPTNTGRLFVRMVENATLIPFALRGQAFDPGPLADRSIPWRVLYPGGAALDPQAPGGFVVLDGTWTQAARMCRRVPIVADLPRVALPPGPPSIWKVREQRAGGMSSFEAALRVLELREGAEAVEPLRRAFAKVVARMLFLKGRLPTPDAVL
jgi:DTW domain-containing protein YfiP